MTSRRGLALVSVLWVLALLSLMAATFTRTTRTEINLARNLLEQTKAEALADAGIHWTAAKLAEPVEDGGWWLDGRVHRLQLEEGEVRVYITDEAGKIDLNAVSRDLLEALFRALDYDPNDSSALADAIVDFRDPDKLRQLNGAEDDDYAAAGLKHDSKDSPFEAVAELQQVLGMPPQLYRRIAPVLTVYTRQRLPNEETASELVKSALTGQKLERSDQTAEDPLAEEDPSDEEPEEEPAAPTVGTTDEEVDGELGRPKIRSRLDLYSVHAEGRTAGGAVFARDAVLRILGPPGPPYQLFDWRQGRRILFGRRSAENNEDE